MSEVERDLRARLLELVVRASDAVADGEYNLAVAILERAEDVLRAGRPREAA